MIHPAHGAGSPCGADIGDRLQSTIGYERDSNPFLQFEDVKEFTDYALSTAPPIPTYYPRMKKINAKGPEIIGNLPRVPGLPPKAFKEAVADKKNVLIDTRTMLGFGGGHIRGALNIGGWPMLSIWAGWLLDPARPILLVLEKDSALENIVKYFIRTGYTKFAGYLVGGMKAWDNAGFEIERVPQMSVHELKKANGKVQTWMSARRTNGKAATFPAHIICSCPTCEKAARFSKKKPTAVYCDSGYRASLATSMLKQEGFTDVRNVPGNGRLGKRPASRWKAKSRERAGRGAALRRPFGWRARGGTAHLLTLPRRRTAQRAVPALLALLPGVVLAAEPRVNALQFSGPAWSPYLVGAGIGVLSWLTFYFADRPIGASSFTQLWPVRSAALRPATHRLARLL